MFSYCTRTLASISTTIGEFLSRRVNWLDEDGNLKTVKEINTWNRKFIAQRYLVEYFCPTVYDKEMRAIGGAQNASLFIDQVAIKIDEFIPRRYFIKYCEINKIYGTAENINLKIRFEGKDNHEFTKDLVFHYEINKVNDDKMYKKSLKATFKQKSYIRSLAFDSGYALKNEDNLLMRQASDLIMFLVGETDKKPKFFPLYFELY